MTEVSSSGSSSDEDMLVWEDRSIKKKPKWLRETLKDALKSGTPSDKVRAINMPDRLGMVLVAYTRYSEPSTFEEAS